MGDASLASVRTRLAWRRTALALAVAALMVAHLNGAHGQAAPGVGLAGIAAAGAVGVLRHVLATTVTCLALAAAALVLLAQRA